ncbi:histidine--tRNA ligase [Marinomonas mediterranea]|uniref:Histidine--tRNA ligase n=1 Tax=Marinomonas mediterranea (strain ATCC 700492 / JCM 21426 / NBRC 103028 / MMB-1) TaxID=717774 RepID=F2JUT4_MARM1|nr:histidine--tRNA ligase [Marinomonas mediterranea]ADZ90499.1 Histidyl-tRNA synthetase [Marinomonas mediterranea MMB-1]WCN16678.1 histidine--tRNA ligase [Marinomonas mediterranea MMB-1]
MGRKVQAIRGMNDILPGQSSVWQYIENAVANVVKSYGYHQIRFPVVEHTELFKRGVGETTDIVEKEMYTFDDRNGESLTLRPEGTASCVRAADQAGLLFNQVQRLWYVGPMFRYERPQKGRYRQFHQIGVESFGMATPDIDAELIILTARLWKQLGLLEHVELQLNTIGVAEARENFKASLVDYLTEYKDELDEDSQRRLTTNPLRILDSKDQKTQKILEGAPSLDQYIDQESQEQFERLQAILKANDVSYVINRKLVRGLDYYGKTVFEWVTTHLGAQATVCAGGRYDGLVEQLGGKATPAVGFAMGIERLVLLLETLELIPDAAKASTDVFVVSMGADAELTSFSLAESIREALPNLTVLRHCGGGNFKNQMKKADKSGARFTLILGDNEVANNECQIKDMTTGQQESCALDKVSEYLSSF